MLWGCHLIPDYYLTVSKYWRYYKKSWKQSENGVFLIIVDEGTFGSNKEQLSFCLQYVDENLNAFEDFIDFYQLENIKSSTIVLVIKDIFMRM